ncbi:aminoglycoside phosphotransferase family protein [Phaeovulum vinaykumarii]|uniref:Aminoglycoside phosphotransferase domain-containing protein n=1 Tax=Phaeovulum vinaykumarii TaxID=407234 RepID=A0A1N7K997_9RHOB|nr:phosphotransferase [Phaeovulum vinaykumarii]SIS58176.1 hypothetical protein SAMN05421795_101729 [Phaeovulum vinaykumarii]SOB93707.1 hypothetical protein SAMN05878426_101725 [Phaeovulum vinaykumarii]
MSRAATIAAFLAKAGWGGARRSPLAGDASARRYERLDLAGQRAVLMDVPPGDTDQVARFLRVGDWLLAQGFSAPRVLARAPGDGLLLLEDLGDDLIARLVAADPAREGDLYHAIGVFLLELHARPAPAFLPRLDAPALADLVGLIESHYLPAAGAPARVPELAARVAEACADDGLPSVCALRDFHAENLIWLPARKGAARLGLLDFQDAVAAHPAYDLVSVLQDARRDVPAAIEAAVRAQYVTARGLDGVAFDRAYAALGAQRALRILGVFARLCREAGKPRYVDLMPRVWAQLMRNLDHPALADLRAVVVAALPAPTPDLCERIKARCPAR